MKLPVPTALLTILALALPASANDAAPTSMNANPLFTPSTLPGQFPHFDLIKEAHFIPAYERGMAEQLQEVEAIVRNPQPATFDNTIVAL